MLLHKKNHLKKLSLRVIVKKAVLANIDTSDSACVFGLWAYSIPLTIKICPRDWQVLRSSGQEVATSFAIQFPIVLQMYPVCRNTKREMDLFNFSPGFLDYLFC